MTRVTSDNAQAFTKTQNEHLTKRNYWLRPLGSEDSATDLGGVHGIRTLHSLEPVIEAPQFTWIERRGNEREGPEMKWPLKSMPSVTQFSRWGTLPEISIITQNIVTNSGPNLYLMPRRWLEGCVHTCRNEGTTLGIDSPELSIFLRQGLLLTGSNQDICGG